MALDVILAGPSMRVEVSGGEGDVWATAGDRRWLARPAGVSGTVVDARAPLHTVVTYTDGTDTVSVVRDLDAQTIFTSLDGQTVVPFKLSHEWTYPVRPDAHVLRAGGRSWVTFGKEPFRGPWQMRVLLEGPHIAALETMVERRERVVFLHNRSWCSLPHCPAPDVIVGHVTDLSGEITGRKDVAQMAYRLQVDAVRDGQRLVVPAFTWGDVAASHATWADLSGSWADVRDGR